MRPVPQGRPDDPFGRPPYGAGFSADGPDGGSGAFAAAGPQVGDFVQGSPISRWAVSRYLVGRVILDRVSTGLLVLAAVLFAGAIALGAGTGLTALAVLLGIVAVIVLLMRVVLAAILRRLTSVAVFGPDQRHRVDRLVHDARGDVLRELRRVGLPGRSWTLPLLLVRLVGRRRAETMNRFRAFDVDRAVPPARRDELHMIVEGATGGLRV